MIDHRDMLIEGLVLDVLTLEARNVSLATDAAVFREILGAAFDAIRDLTVQHDRDVEEKRRLQDEARWLREGALLRAAADDPEVGG